MAITPEEMLNKQRERVTELVEGGGITDACGDALLEFADALDNTKSRPVIHDENGQAKTYSLRSADGYVSNLRISAKQGLDLLNTTAEEVDDFMHSLHENGGLTKPTISNYQAAAKLFYQYYDLEVEPDEITVFSEKTQPAHDATDLFTQDDIDALRRACGSTQLATRNRALLELLVFTGQRLTALLTLRISDIDLQEGYIYLNDDYATEFGGLKGALNRGRRRPMFGATKYVRDWIEYHPYGGDDDAYLFVGSPSHRQTKQGDHWSQNSARDQLYSLQEIAEVEKPVNPHNFRHYFATIMYRDYGLDADTIRMLLGHVKGSSTFEDIYSHVVESDHIEAAEEALGYKDTEPAEPLTPDFCTTCGELLRDDWRSCPNCGQQFGPVADDDLDAAADELQDDVTDRALDSDTDLSESDADVLDALLDAVDDPDALADRLRQLSD